jgi:hypothetical protein
MDPNAPSFAQTGSASRLNGNSIVGFRVSAGMEVKATFTPSKKGEDCYYFVQYVRESLGILDANDTGEHFGLVGGNWPGKIPSSRR